MSSELGAGTKKPCKQQQLYGSLHFLVAAELHGLTELLTQRAE